MPINQNYIKIVPKNSVISSSFFRVLVVLLLLPIAVFAIIKPKDIYNQFASNNTSNAQTKTTYNIPVAVIMFLPDENKDGNVDDFTGYGGSVSSLRSKIMSDANEIIEILNKGSKYKGYSDPSAVASLDYRILSDLIFEQKTKPPKGFKVPWNNAYRPDYNKILNQYKVCDLVEKRGVKEIWMWTYHNSDIEPAESNFIARINNNLIDISNSERRVDDMPVCNKSYTLYNYNFTRGPAEGVHNHGHQLEAMLGNFDYGLFWDKWAGATAYDEVYNPGCGWTHEPPNAGVNKNKTYDYLNTSSRKTNCEDWKPEGTSISKNVSCKTWTKYYYGNEYCGTNQNGEKAFYTWWMQNLPGYGNTLTYNGSKLRNWWDVIGDFEKTENSHAGLLLPQSSSQDTTFPVISILSPGDKDIISDTKTISVTASDENSIISLKIYFNNSVVNNCGAVTSCNYALNPKSYANGNYIIKVEASDGINVSSKQIQVQIYNLSPVPTTTPTITPTSLPVPTIITTPVPSAMPTAIPTILPTGVPVPTSPSTQLPPINSNGGQISFPIPSTIVSKSSINFSWSNIKDVKTYKLLFGTTVGSSNLGTKETSGTAKKTVDLNEIAKSVTPGSTLYVTLQTKLKDGSTYNNYYKYTLY